MLYTYVCEIERIVDGDTVDCIIDLGFGVKIKERVRLDGIDAPEVRTRDLQEKERGKEAALYLENIFNKSKNVILKSKEFNRGKYGRVIGDFYVYMGDNINPHSVCDMLVDAKLAERVEY